MVRPEGKEIGIATWLLSLLLFQLSGSQPQPQAACRGPQRQSGVATATIAASVGAASRSSWGERRALGVLSSSNHSLGHRDKTQSETLLLGS